MANENSIRDALAFYEEISNEIRRAYKELFLFIDTFSRVYKREKLKLPYHVNIIEELHINENAHSRILLKFLLYKNDKGEYEIFQSLLKYIRCNSPSNKFGNIKITKPKLTQEIARIDMWIRDKNYAIIFENKARNAVDQKSQLSRYIERTINDGYKKEQIFVVYMPPTLKEPAEQSWGTYEEEFKERYFCLSFREHVLPWLKNDVVPNVRQKDLYLSSALAQYIDYLEYTVFKTSEIYKNMNMELEKIISSHLELGKKEPIEQVHLLDEKITAVAELQSRMESLKKQIRIKYIANFVDSKKGDLDIHVEDYKVTTVVEDAIVELNVNDKGVFYCTIYYVDKKNIEEDSILFKFIDDNILDKSNNTDVWKYLSTDIECYEDLFNLFLKVIKTYRDEYFKQQSAIKKLKGKLQELQELPEKKDEWHIWHGWILAVSFNDNTEKKIGIESNFEEENGNACAKFKIFITTWGNHDESLNSWNLYKTAIMEESKYGDFDLDKGEIAGGNGRVYLHVTKRKGSDTDGIDGSNTDEIIEKLSECYSFLEKLAKDVAKE